MRRFFKRYLPHHHAITERRSLRFLGALTKDPYLLHLNRRSVAGACFVGVFCAFIPVPVQMLLATLLAVLFRTNLPLAICLTWISNPLTYAPIFYFNYLVGTYLLGTRASEGDLINTVDKTSAQITANWQEPGLIWGQIVSIWKEFDHIWIPLFSGSFVTGVFAGLIAYIAIRVYWRMHVSRHWHIRKLKRSKQFNANRER